ncbi:hypothetical protein MKQ68_19360 [Chitinophaga horti]|uniref:Lipoprotein n=1 Tax=Chitinophaga horti TaxID=2920382 RepID=A0ABY6IYB9_9BACT|nr:hypothetical protein [Chitinophaga horti]UYQ92248.1 hypothetical protein MKQ68_19360 [Chitinophaga horti]
MKIYSIVVMIVALGLLAACGKQSTHPPIVKGVVRGEDWMACGGWFIRIPSGHDSIDIRATNLPGEFQVSGTVINFSYEKDPEPSICRAYGIPTPGFLVFGVEKFGH